MRYEIQFSPTLLISFVCLFLVPNSYLFGQCSSLTFPFEGALAAPITVFQTQATTRAGYYTFEVPAEFGCLTYDFTFCSDGGSATFNTTLTIVNDADVFAGGFNNDACGTRSEILGWVPPNAGTFRVLITRNGCNNTNKDAVLAYRLNNTEIVVGDYSLAGDATDAGADCIRLTSAVNDQSGCTWDASSTLNFAADFSFDFTVNLGASDAGADGIAFVIQNDPAGRCACATGGSGFGASGITNSIIFEIDTFLNTEDRDDGVDMDGAGVICVGGPEPDHLDIWENGNVNPFGACGFGARIIPTAKPLLDGGVDYNVENGLDHIFRVEWGAGTTTITGTLLDMAGAIVYATVSHTFDPLAIFGTETPYFGFTAATGGLNNEQVFCNSPVLLSVNLLEFYAECSGSENKLRWQTASETNSSHFIILRSSDGVNYEPIGAIESAGISSSIKSYRFVDSYPFEGISYYTLKEVDLDGVEQLTGRVSVVDCNKLGQNFKLFPNPVKRGESITISFETILSPAIDLFITDSRGRIVYSDEIENINKDEQVYQFSPNLSPGVYQVTLRSEQKEKVKSQKLIVMQ